MACHLIFNLDSIKYPPVSLFKTSFSNAILNSLHLSINPFGGDSVVAWAMRGKQMILGVILITVSVLNQSVISDPGDIEDEALEAAIKAGKTRKYFDYSSQSVHC